MRYIVVEYNPKDPSLPDVRLYKNLERATTYARKHTNDKSPINLCRIYLVTSDLRVIPSRVIGDAKRDKEVEQHVLENARGILP